MSNAFDDMILNMTDTATGQPDYTGEDGLLYCGKCRKPKEAYFPEGKTLFGRDRHPAECDCQRASREEREAAGKQHRHREEVDTLTKFGKGDKTPDPYTPEQVKALMQRVEGTAWDMPVILGGLYGMRRSEILGLRWQNVDLEKGTFDVIEQLPFKVPPKTKIIEEMAPPKSNGRTLPITDVALPFFLKQIAMQETQKEQAEKEGKPYYYNDLVVAKPDGAPVHASWVFSQFGKMLEGLDMPRIRFHDLRHPYVKPTTKLYTYIIYLNKATISNDWSPYLLTFSVGLFRI